MDPFSFLPIAQGRSNDVLQKASVSKIDLNETTLISASLSGVASGIGLVFLGSTVVSAVAAGIRFQPAVPSSIVK